MPPLSAAFSEANMMVDRFGRLLSTATLCKRGMSRRLPSHLCLSGRVSKNTLAWEVNPPTRGSDYTRPSAVAVESVGVLSRLLAQCHCTMKMRCTKGQNYWVTSHYFADNAELRVHSFDPATTQSDHSVYLWWLVRSPRCSLRTDCWRRPTQAS